MSAAGGAVAALEASGEEVSVALRLPDGGILAARCGDKRGRDPAAWLARLLDEGGVEARTLRRIVVDRGPGSYTGLRVALALAKTLARWIPCELAAATSLEVLGRQAVDSQSLPAGTLLGVLLDARRGRLAGALLEWDGARLRFVLPPAAHSPSRWATLLPAGIVLCGEDEEPLRLMGRPDRRVLCGPRDARTLLALGLAAPVQDPLLLEPLYLMASAAEEGATALRGPGA